MTAIVLGLAVLAACLAGFSYSTAQFIFDTARAGREHSHEMARLHNAQIARLIEEGAAERREAAQERTVLLNRIQDPIATAMTSNVMLVPPTPSEDLSLEYEH